MTATASIESYIMPAIPTPGETTNTAPNMKGPVTWDICGFQNNWNWTISPNVDDIKYQTRFPAQDLALVYRGADASVPLLASIKTNGFGTDAEITFHTAPGGSKIGASNPIKMVNTAGDFSHRWPVKVSALGGRELLWEYEHPAYGNNDVYLTDPATKEVLGDANDNYMALRKEMPEDVVEELVITGTAAQVMLAPLMYGSMQIAAQGPEGRERWKYQDPNYAWDSGDSEEGDKEKDDEDGEAEGDKKD